MVSENLVQDAELIQIDGRQIAHVIEALERVKESRGETTSISSYVTTDEWPEAVIKATYWREETEEERRLREIDEEYSRNRDRAYEQSERKQLERLKIKYESTKETI